MTYKQAQIAYWQRYNETVKTCWIAHVKELNGVAMGKAPNRSGERKHPCPESVRPKLEKILKQCGMI